VKTKSYDWLWWNIGIKIWRLSVRFLPKAEVQRRLAWMELDCEEIDLEERHSK
jgi:hypothetical protein